MLRSIPAAAAVLLSLLLVACSGSSGSNATPTSEAAATVTATPDPTTMVDAAAEAIKDVTSFHFRLEHENGGSPMPLGLQLLTAEGDIVVPDRLKAEVDAKAGGFNLSVDVAAIGDETWITNPFTREWQTLPNATIRDIADPVALVEAVTSAIEDVTYEGDEKIDGVETLIFNGSMDSSALQDALSFAETGHTVEVRVWIAAEDQLPRRVRIEGPLNGDEAENIVRLIELSGYNSDIEITAPQ